MKDEIATLIKDRLRSVYCDTCDSTETRENCENCHRKYMNWSASNSFCSRLANEIVEKYVSVSNGSSNSVE